MGDFERITISMLLACGIIIAFTTFYADVATKYSIVMPNNLSANLSSVNLIKNISSQSQGTFKNISGLNSSSSGSIGQVNPFWVFLSFAWDGLKLMFYMPVLMVSFFTDLIVALTGLGIAGFEVPFWFPMITSAVIWIVIVFGIIRFLKGDTSDV